MGLSGVGGLSARGTFPLLPPLQREEGALLAHIAAQNFSRDGVTVAQGPTCSQKQNKSDRSATIAVCLVKKCSTNGLHDIDIDIFFRYLRVASFNRPEYAKPCFLEFHRISQSRQACKVQPLLFSI